MPTAAKPKKPRPSRAVLAKRKLYREVYAAKRAAGLCVQTHCPRKARPGKSRCKRCEAWLRERVQKVKARVRAGHTRTTRPY